MPLTRRQILRLLGASGVAAVVPSDALALGEEACTAAPASILGPYFVDEDLARSDIRSDPGSGVVQSGVPLALRIVVQHADLDCVSASGVRVDVWHANPAGLYSDEAPLGTLGQRYLRGHQITDADGAVAFTTVYPGAYVGRTIHVHARLRRFDGSTPTSDFVTQIYFDEATTAAVLANPLYAPSDTTNATDPFFLPALTAATAPDGAGGYAATITLAVAGIPVGEQCAATDPLAALQCAVDTLAADVDVLSDARVRRRLRRLVRGRIRRQVVKAIAGGDRVAARVLPRARQGVARLRAVLAHPWVVDRAEAVTLASLDAQARTVDALLVALTAP